MVAPAPQKSASLNGRRRRITPRRRLVLWIVKRAGRMIEVAGPPEIAQFERLTDAEKWRRTPPLLVPQWSAAVIARNVRRRSWARRLRPTEMMVRRILWRVAPDLAALRREKDSKAARGPIHNPNTTR